MTKRFPIAGLVVATLLGWQAPTYGAADQEAGAQVCHALMTEQECDRLRAELAALPEGPARCRLLAQHALAMREREAACACHGLKDAEVQPLRQQTHASRTF